MVWFFLWLLKRRCHSWDSSCTLGFVLRPCAVIFTFFSFHFEEIGVYFKSNFDSSDNKIYTVQVRSAIFCYS